MADLNLDINYFDHIKTKRLLASLGKGADVLPIRLWCYTGKHRAKDGRLTGHSAEDIETAVGWWGKKGECVRVMLEFRFLDLKGEVYAVHNWKKRSGHLSAFSIRASAAAKARWRKAREAAEGDACAQTSIAQVGASNAPTTQPNPRSPPTQPHPPTEHANGLGKASGSNGSGSGSGGLGNLGPVFSREDAKLEKSVGIQRVLKEAKVNPSLYGEFMSRNDLSAAIVTNELEDIQRDPKVDPAAVLVARLRKKRYG